MTRKPDPLDHLADALAEDIVDAPAERILAEAAEDHGDDAALAAAFDGIAARAARQARPRRLADRIGALAAMLAPKGAWRPAMAAVAGLAVIVVAGDLYWHVRPEIELPAAVPAPASAPAAAARDTVAQDALAREAVTKKAVAPEAAKEEARQEAAGAGFVPAQDRRADAAYSPAQVAAAPPPAAEPAPQPPAAASAPAEQARRGKTLATNSAPAAARVAEAPAIVRAPVRDDRLHTLLDYERARTYDQPGRAVSQLAQPNAPRPVAPGLVAPLSRLAGLSFDWPLRGRVLARGEGIDVAAPSGTDVRAAADGLVIYAGGADKGFGNLILVRHRDGFVTVYGYTSRILVKAGDEIRRGQVIAKSGASGEAAEPQLHFEIRKDVAPVDPAQYLPRG